MPKMSTDYPEHHLGGPTMGTRWTATIVDQPGLDLSTAGDALGAAVDLVDRQMSTWKPDSDLMRLNHAAPEVWVSLPAELMQVLTAALEIGRLSDGAFDIGLGEIVNAWGFGAAGPADIDAIKRALAATHRPTHETLELDPAQGRARKNTVAKIDLSGIAKGFAVDMMRRAIEQLGIKNALLGLDGELYAKGHKADGTPWPIAIEKPDYEARLPLSVIAFQDAAIATSGDYRHWVNVGDVRLAHTMDRRRGGPVQNPVASVTVLAASCMVADAWATALLVLGPEDGPELARRQGLDALFILRDRDNLRQIPVGIAFDAA